jgi:pimeloyl-ACP methyl ester carboxylesterase
MTTWLLIPGAGGAAWYWHRVVERLRAAGDEAVAVDLPSEDPDAGVEAYVDVAREALGDRPDAVVVGQSLGGFTATDLCTRVPVRRLVLLNAMIPAVGEPAGDWWVGSGRDAAKRAADEAAGRDGSTFDPFYEFLHDVPPEVLAGAEEHDRPESDAVFRLPWTLREWPRVPVTVVVGRHDRFFPADFQVRLARERAGVVAQVIDAGHLAALSNPDGVVEALHREP